MSSNRRSPQMGLDPRPCEVCGAEFRPYRASSKFCSDPCRSKAAQERVKRFHADNPGASMRYRSRRSAEGKARVRDAQKSYHVRNRFGISVDEYESLMDYYGRKCGICGVRERVGLDHDHLTGEIRGVLCIQHNTALGNLGDSKESIWRVYSYLMGAPFARPTWTEYFLSIASAVALRGDCVRSRVGAVLVEDRSNRILSAGFNGTAPGSPGCLAGDCARCLSDTPSGEDYFSCLETHAEQNCLEWERLDLRRREATMYLTRPPCEGCQRLMVEQDVLKVVFRTEDGYSYLELGDLA